MGFIYALRSEQEKNEAYIVLGYSFLCTRYGGIVISCLLFPVCQHRRQ